MFVGQKKEAVSPLRKERHHRCDRIAAVPIDGNKLRDQPGVKASESNNSFLSYLPGVTINTRIDGAFSSVRSDHCPQTQRSRNTSISVSNCVAHPLQTDERCSITLNRCLLSSQPQRAQALCLQKGAWGGIINMALNWNGSEKN